MNAHYRRFNTAQKGRLLSGYPRLCKEKLIENLCVHVAASFFMECDPHHMCRRISEVLIGAFQVRNTPGWATPDTQTLRVTT
jgi:hypothetical protein